MATSPTWLEFCDTTQGRAVTAWEKDAFARFVSQATGDIALQIGTSEIDALRASSMGLNLLVQDRLSEPQETPYEIVFGLSDALPIASDTVDLALWPHGLDRRDTAPRSLSEIHRVLADEGLLITTFLNRCGTWQISRLIGRRPDIPQELSPRMVQDVKKDLVQAGFHIEAGAFGVYGVTSKPRTTLWIEQAGDRWWPTFSNIVILVARKRQAGQKLVGKVNFANPVSVPVNRSLANGSVGRNMKIPL